MRNRKWLVTLVSPGVTLSAMSLLRGLALLVAMTSPLTSRSQFSYYTIETNTLTLVRFDFTNSTTATRVPIGPLFPNGGGNGVQPQDLAWGNGALYLLARNGNSAAIYQIVTNGIFAGSAVNGQPLAIQPNVASEGLTWEDATQQLVVSFGTALVNSFQAAYVNPVSGAIASQTGIQSGGAAIDADGLCYSNGRFFVNDALNTGGNNSLLQSTVTPPQTIMALSQLGVVGTYATGLTNDYVEDIDTYNNQWLIGTSLQNNFLYRVPTAGSAGVQQVTVINPQLGDRYRGIARRRPIAAGPVANPSLPFPSYLTFERSSQTVCKVSAGTALVTALANPVNILPAIVDADLAWAGNAGYMLASFGTSWRFYQLITNGLFGGWTVGNVPINSIDSQLMPITKLDAIAEWNGTFYVFYDQAGAPALGSLPVVPGIVSTVAFIRHVHHSADGACRDWGILAPFFYAVDETPTLSLIWTNTLSQDLYHNTFAPATNDLEDSFPGTLIAIGSGFPTLTFFPRTYNGGSHSTITLQGFVPPGASFRGLCRHYGP